MMNISGDITGAQYPGHLQSLTNDDANWIKYVRPVFGSYGLLEKQLAMGYKEAIKNINFEKEYINDANRKVLTRKYGSEPIKIDGTTFLGMPFSYTGTKVSYQMKDDKIIIVYDIYTMHPALNGDVLKTIKYSKAIRKTVPISKQLEQGMYHCLRKKPGCYEIFTKNELSHWIILENKTVLRACLLNSQENIEKKSSNCNILCWIKYIDCPANTYLQLDNGTRIPIVLTDKEWNIIMEYSKTLKRFGIKITDFNGVSQCYSISYFGIYDQEITGDNKMHYYGLGNSSIRSSEPPRRPMRLRLRNMAICFCCIVFPMCYIIYNLFLYSSTS